MRSFVVEVLTPERERRVAIYRSGPNRT
jgi:hypothetical protein